MIERINKLLKQIEWRRYVTSREGITISTCPSCHHPQFGQYEQAGGHASDCELKACLDAIESEEPMTNDELDRLIAYHEFQTSPTAPEHRKWAAGLRAMKNQELERINKLVKRLEWAGTRKGEGQRTVCCPVCFLPPQRWFDGHRFILAGHTPDCELKACLEAMDTRAKTEESKS